MKRLLFILLGVMLLFACGKDEPKKETNEELGQEDVSEKEESTQETINEQEHDIVLVDNDDLMITLIDSEHVRVTDHEDKDVVILNLSIENKQNRSFNIYLDELSVDGRSEKYEIGMSETEIKPNDEIKLNASFTVDILNENKLLEFEEHLSGRFTYSDYDGNREQVEFSEYINE